MKTLTIFIVTILFSLSINAHNENKLTIYTYDSFVSEWGPGPIIESIFEEKYNAEIELIAVDSAATLLNKVILDYEIKGIVVGNPINMDGSSSQSSQSAKDLAINLSKDVTENVTLWDERLSSQGAFNLSNDLASNTSKKISKLDENSAQFILQGALDYLTKENTWSDTIKRL